MSELLHGVDGSAHGIARAHGWAVGIDAGRPAPRGEIPYVRIYSHAFRALPPEGRNALIDAARKLLVAHAPETVWADFLEGGKLRFVDEKDEEFHGCSVLCVVATPDYTATIMGKGGAE